MNVTEVCEYLDISRQTLYRRMDEGLIKPLPKPVYLKRHKKLEFLRSDIEALKNPQ